MKNVFIEFPLQVFTNLGPCGGKTSALKQLQSTLSEKGYKVFTIPEASTIIQTNGALYPGDSPDRADELFAFEESMLKMVLGLENAFHPLVEYSNKVNNVTILLYDRGLKDVEAYVNPSLWEKLLHRFEVTNGDWLKRYDVICHLVTAADGAEEFYTTQNNAARTESAEQAIALDRKIQKVWEEHPNRFVIKNEGSFSQKMDTLCHVLIHFIESQLQSQQTAALVKSSAQECDETRV